MLSMKGSVINLDLTSILTDKKRIIDQIFLVRTHIYSLKIKLVENIMVRKVTILISTLADGAV